MSTNVTVNPAGFRARGFIRLLQTVGAISRPFDHKGLWHVARYAGMLLGTQAVCEVPVGRSSRFSFLCNDPYWSRMVVASYEYEDELAGMFARLRGERYSFLDCGANHGLWSIISSEPGSGAERVVAIEASSLNLRHLERNWILNDRRFEIVHRAIFSRSGETVHIEQSANNHAGAAIGRGSGQEVETVTIDDLTAASGGSELPWIIKLDVEGVEIPALEGATRTLEDAAIIVYEDHGNDPTSKVTHFIRETLGLDVFFRNGSEGYVNIPSARDATRFKSNPSVGYNFFAVTAAARDLFDRIR